MQVMAIKETTVFQTFDLNFKIAVRKAMVLLFKKKKNPYNEHGKMYIDVPFHQMIMYSTPIYQN